MPLYDYKCARCGYVFEVQQRITEEPLQHCPKCKGQIKRLISPAGIIFKGSGFHVTDYGRKQTADSGKQKSGIEKKKESKPKKTKETKNSTKASSPPRSK